MSSESFVEISSDDETDSENFVVDDSADENGEETDEISESEISASFEIDEKSDKSSNFSDFSKSSTEKENKMKNTTKRRKSLFEETPKENKKFKEILKRTFHDQKRTRKSASGPGISPAFSASSDFSNSSPSDSDSDSFIDDGDVPGFDGPMAYRLFDEKFENEEADDPLVALAQMRLGGRDLRENFLKMAEGFFLSLVSGGRFVPADAFLYDAAHKKVTKRILAIRDKFAVSEWEKFCPEIFYFLKCFKRSKWAALTEVEKRETDRFCEACGRPMYSEVTGSKIQFTGLFYPGHRIWEMKFELKEILKFLKTEDFEILKLKNFKKFKKFQKNPKDEEKFEEIPQKRTFWIGDHCAKFLETFQKIHQSKISLVEILVKFLFEKSEKLESEISNLEKNEKKIEKLKEIFWAENSEIENFYENLEEILQMDKKTVLVENFEETGNF